MKGYFQKCLFFAIFGGILLGYCQIPVRIQAKETKTVRVGYYEIEGFMSKDLSGELSGYNMDYLSRIASLTGWNYEFIEVSDMDEGLALLSRREIDLMAPCQLTQIRLQDYKYSANSFGTQYPVLVTRANNEKFSYEDFESFNRMQIGIARNDPIISDFIRYKQEKGFRSVTHYYASQREALIALRASEVDAAVVNLMMAGNDFKILARFTPEPFYYATWNGNTGLMEELDDAMQMLKNTYPGLENALMEEYYPLYDAQFISYEEHKYIESLGTLHVGYLTDRLPLSFQNERGQLDGMAREIFDKISSLSGLKFEYVPLPAGNLSYEYMLENKLDLVTGVEYNSTNLHIEGIKLSNAYFASKKVIVADKHTVFDKEKNMKVAVYKDYQSVQQLFETAYPNFTMIYYDSVEACYNAVQSKEADILIQNQYMVEYWLSRPKYENLEMLPIDGMDDDLCFAVVLGAEGEGASENTDVTMLLSILNKVISQITKDELDTIVLKETMENHYTYTLMDFVYHYKVTIVLSGILLFFVLLIVLYALRLRRRAKKRQEEEKKKLILQQKRYQIIMEESDDMIYEISFSGGSNMVSERVMERFGWTIPSRIDTVTPGHLARIFHVHSADILQMEKVINDIMENDISSECKIRLLQITDKTYVWCKVSCIPLLDDDGTLISIAGKIVNVDAETREKERLHQQTRTDGMTGLINKKTFTEEVGIFLSNNEAQASGIVFVDLDHFKDVNDILGHSIGDIAIREAAGKLQMIFSDFDIVARFGGDEFCLFIEEIERDNFEKKLARAVGRMKSVYTDGTLEVKVTASIGAAYCMAKRIDYQTFLDTADGALYEAKRGGRNQYIFRETAS